MRRIEFWSWSLPRAELDQRSREARLRLEQLERLLVRARASVLRRRRSSLLASADTDPRCASTGLERRLMISGPPVCP